MQCNSFITKLNEYVHEEITDNKLREDMAKHMLDCSACRELYEKRCTAAEELMEAFDSTVQFTSRKDEVLNSIDVDLYKKTVKNRFKLYLSRHKYGYLTAAVLSILIIAGLPFINSLINNFNDIGGARTGNKPQPREVFIAFDQYIKSSSAPLNNSKGELKFYVVKDLNLAQSEKLSLGALPLEDAPILTGADIITYNWTNHTMKLKDSGMEKLNFTPPVDGKPFVVMVDSERIYMGVFWGLHSSLTVPYAPMILLPSRDENSITLKQYGLGSVREDRRIAESLIVQNKLIRTEVAKIEINDVKNSNPGQISKESIDNKKVIDKPSEVKKFMNLLLAKDIEKSIIDFIKGPDYRVIIYYVDSSKEEFYLRPGTTKCYIERDNGNIMFNLTGDSAKAMYDMLQETFK